MVSHPGSISLNENVIVAVASGIFKRAADRIHR